MQDNSPQSLWRYALFNLILLVALSAWLWQKNQPVNLPEATLPADGKVQCISYAPYYQHGQSPFVVGTVVSKAQIDTDLKRIATRSECVRIYSVGQGLDYVPEAASKLGLKVLLGAWIGWTPADNDKELTLAINRANQYPDTVRALIVGNEVLLRGEQSEEALRSYLKRAKQSVKVPVSYADVWEFWLSHKNLEDSVDFVTVHILPYWENNPQPIELAVAHAHEVMAKLGKNFKKPILIGETGWPSIGRQRERSIPSQLNQASYVREFLVEAANRHWQYNLIEAFDQPWKRQLEGTVGGFWGIFTDKFAPKFNFTGPAYERQDHARPFLFGLMGAMFMLGLASVIKLKQRSLIVAAVLLGAITGIFMMLQVDYLNAACGNDSLLTAITCIPTAGRPLPAYGQALEWLFLGGAAIATWLISALIPLLISNRHQVVRLTIRSCFLLLLIGAITAGVLLVQDGRYRDYPVVMYLLPVLQLSIGLMLAGCRLRLPTLGFACLSTAAITTAALCYANETYNFKALLWLAIMVLMLIAVWRNCYSTTIKNND
jgi:exo-beta-1,3-glucanase (GH17 family)